MIVQETVGVGRRYELLDSVWVQVDPLRVVVQEVVGVGGRLHWAGVDSVRVQLHTHLLQTGRPLSLVVQEVVGVLYRLTFLFLLSVTTAAPTIIIHVTLLVCRRCARFPER